MNRDYFEWKSGTVRYWDLDPIDCAKTAVEQVASLKEDLALVEFPHGINLDIGWYSSFSKDGTFVVVVVRDGCWDVPIFEERNGSVGQMIESVRRAISVASTVDPKTT